MNFNWSIAYFPSMSSQASPSLHLVHAQNSIIVYKIKPCDQTLESSSDENFLNVSAL